MSSLQTDPNNFNFDEWMKLAQDNPEAFEQRRRRMIDETISSAPEYMRQRLTGLQWRVDMVRGNSPNSMKSFLEIYKMMWESVYGENGLVQAWRSPKLAGGASKGQKKSAEVITMVGNKKDVSELV